MNETTSVNNREYSEEKGLISVVIPVYNAEPYLEPLMDSIFTQTYKNFEVIAAYETASTDKSLDVLEELAKKYPIIISTGSERCPGGTRNRGMTLAKGEYIVFVDADDLLLPNYLSSFISVFEKYPQIEIASCEYYMLSKDIVSHSGEYYNKILRNHTEHTNIEGDISNIELFDTRTMIIQLMEKKEDVMPWLLMIRRRFIVENSIFFSKKYYGEDDLFIYEIISKATHIGKIHVKTYLHISRLNSICNSRFRKISLDNAAYWDIPHVIEYYFDKNLAKKSPYIRYYVKTALLELSYKQWIDALMQRKISRLSLDDTGKVIDKLTGILFNYSKPLYYLLFRIGYFRSLRA